MSTRRLFLSLICLSCIYGQSYTIRTFAEGYPSGFQIPADYNNKLIFADVAVDSSGNLYYVVDDSVFLSAHGLVVQLAGEGTVFRPHYESGLGVGAGGAVYISSSDAGCDVVKISGGVATVFAGTGGSGYNGDNISATKATVNYPKGVVEDTAGRVFIADGDNQRVRMVVDGIITTVAGGLMQPSGLALDGSGGLYIADGLGNRVYKLSNGVLSVVAGVGGGGGFAGDGGHATNARLNYPYSVAADSFGNLYIADVKNNRVRKVSDGIISTIAGDGTPAFGGDGGPAIHSQLNWPWSVAVDPAGNVYVSDSRNARIRQLTPTLRGRNSASYATVIAPETIAFGEAADLTFDLAVAPPGPWPASLAGISVKITDSRQQTRQAPIYFAGNGQVGFYVPDSTATGLATLELTTASGVKSSTPIRIDPLAPGLYSANASGQGVAAGLWIRENPGGAQTWGYLFDPAKPAGNRVAVPVDLGAGGEVYISLYGTGLRHASKASATIGGLAVPVYGFAPTSEYQGEDIVNIGPLPKSLSGRGELEVVVTFDDKTANVVTANFQ